MNIIFETIFGSHLYGTNGENSDSDVKGVYIAENSDIILRRDKDTICHNSKPSSATHRNLQTDKDHEYKELRAFIKDALAGQTYALDMLFAPKQFWLKSNLIWDFVLDNRRFFLSKNVAPFLGYCRQQAGKYGLKGSRLGELLRVIEHLKLMNPKARLEENLPSLSEFVTVEKFLMKRPNGLDPIEQTFLCVLGKKFEVTRFVEQTLPVLEMLNNKYGERARLAEKNKGIDWKAISHAFRCCYQLIELSETHQITFPLREAEKLKQIKRGQLEYSALQEDLQNLMERVETALRNSTLPEQPHYAFWDQFILHIYLGPTYEINKA